MLKNKISKNKNELDLFIELQKEEYQKSLKTRSKDYEFLEQMKIKKRQKERSVNDSMLSGSI